MFEFLKEMLIAPLEMIRGDEWLEKIIGAFLAIMYLLITLLMLYGSYWLIDNIGQSEQDAYGIVIGRSYTPAHTTTSLVSTGKTVVPITTFHPEDWRLQIKVDDETDWISVSEKLCNSCQPGEKILVTYVNGRLSDDLYIRKIREK